MTRDCPALRAPAPAPARPPPQARRRRWLARPFLRSLAAALVLLRVSAKPAYACLWFPWDAFSPLPQCPVFDKIQHKNNMVQAGLALAAKLPTYVRRYHEVKQEVVQWQKAAKESRAFMERVHYYVGHAGELVPDPLPSLVAEFNREQARMKYILDRTTNAFTGVAAESLLTEARGRLKTEVGLGIAMGFDEARYAFAGHMKDQMRALSEDAKKAGIDFDSVTMKVDRIRRYATKLDSVVTGRVDAYGGAEATKRLFLARLNAIQSGQIATMQRIDAMRREAIRRAYRLQQSGAKTNGIRASVTPFQGRTP